MKKTIIIILTIVLLSSVFTYGNINQIRRQGFVEGYLLEPIDDLLVIESYEGEFYYLPLSSTVIYTIDGYIVDKTNFIPGMEMYVKLRGTNVVSVEGYSTSNLGYIPSGSKIKTGRVAKINRNQLVLKLATGDEETFFIMPHTITLKNGQSVNIDTLYEGDKVKLFFDEYDTNIVSRINIEGDSVKVRGLYKGKLNIADRHSNKITLADVHQLKNGAFKQLSPSITLPYNSNSPLYVGGYSIPHDNLKFYSGKTVYLAMKDFFGKEQVEKMVVQNQYETTYSDKIVDINWFTEDFELKNNKNISFNDGTIVIKNDRIVDIYSLNAQSDVFVVADGRGLSSSADVIYVLNEDINNSNIGEHYIYAGRMDQIVEDRLWLKDFFLLDENEWQSFKGEKELFFDNDTHIYDLTNDKKISVKEFYSGSYAVDESSDYAKEHNLRDWHSYIYTDGDRISAIMVQEKMDSLLKQRTTNGLISSVDYNDLVGWEISLTNARDWSSIHSKWMEKNADLEINLEEALLIKDGRQIEPHELKLGDRVYLVRNDYYAKVLLVK